MAMEHQPAGPPLNPGAGADLDASARALRAQLLATEHWSLLATRSMSWNESFSRAGMFLSLLSGAVVALALVAQATAFGDGFSVFALMLLPVVLYVGLATFIRLLEINNEDLVWVRGMNRLRRAYIEMDPSLETYFITGTTEDPAAYLKTYGASTEGSSLLHVLVITPTTVAVVNAVLAAVLLSILLMRMEQGMASVAAIGVVAFLAAFVGQMRYASSKSTMAVTLRTPPPGTEDAERP